MWFDVEYKNSGKYVEHVVGGNKKCALYSLISLISERCEWEKVFAEIQSTSIPGSVDGVGLPRSTTDKYLVGNGIIEIVAGK